jgi:hypothetical protein
VIREENFGLPTGSLLDRLSPADSLDLHGDLALSKHHAPHGKAEKAV